MFYVLSGWLGSLKAVMQKVKNNAPPERFLLKINTFACESEQCESVLICQAISRIISERGFV